MLFVYALRPQESTATTRMSSRRPPLHTCGVSFMAIANEAYKKAQHFSGAFGLLTNNMAKSASLISPFIYALQCQLLVIFLSVDEFILTVENNVETVFPSSKHVFDKVDEFVHIAETLPEKIEDGFHRFPNSIHQVPFLDWALVHAISWLNFLDSKLTDWGSGSKEKAIPVDTSCNGNVNKSAVVEEANHAMESEKHDRMVGCDLPGGTETRFCPNIGKGSFKDALLEKGKKDRTKRKEKEETKKGSCDIDKQETVKGDKKMKGESLKEERAVRMVVEKELVKLKPEISTILFWNSFNQLGSLDLVTRVKETCSVVMFHINDSMVK